MIILVHNIFRAAGESWLEIFPGEDLCPECKGKGGKYSPVGGYTRRCKRCKGVGKLDWIQKAMGG